MSAQQKEKPANADYLEAWTVKTEHEHECSTVEIYWYKGDRLRIRIPKGAPAVISGAYLEGGTRDDVNLKIAKRD